MAAPIQRYSDPRLYGTTLVRPFNASYQWIKTAAYPLHPKSSLIIECAVRAIKITTGTLGLVATALPALVGRLIQIIHYHSISKEARANPQQVAVKGIELPHLRPDSMPSSKKFYAANEAAAIGILRWGFDLTKIAPESKMAEAVYVFASDTISATCGVDQLILSLDLKEGEVACITDNELRGFTIGKDFSDKKVMAAIRKLFYQNGYRAIRYTLDRYDKEEAWAVYEPSCISIRKIQRSPRAEEPP